MTQPAKTPWSGQWWELPPLILHPFDRGLDAPASFDSIKLALHLAGMGEAEVDKERLLRGRYSEFRMLALVGKDVMRWIAQCMDFASRDQALANAGIRSQSFADLAVHRTPPAVAARFESWGVFDYRRILSRSIGLNAVFPNPPGFEMISTGFLEDYYAYADSLFACYLGLASFTVLETAAFGFSIYTSDEYLSRMGCTIEDGQADDDQA